MEKDIELSKTQIFIIIMVFLLGLGIGVWLSRDIFYKRGQVDALKGKYKYELKIESKIETDSIYIKIK